MGLITSQWKEMKHLTTCAQLSTLKCKKGQRMLGDLIEAKRYLKRDYIKNAFE